ncbi:PaaI family thioesterase [Trinickia violacea]|uniref:Medium/long-chain acyl-CoA thioesterase YigI n=1 Tax=Trinickia violacea TaxID=2571746 RepID=A0A4P8J110_9BURK|nr:PaaI family thioesterase [Trinickia violacea]QCP54641.1 PaaI family thioesterase [Trinickia violacea]
MTDFVDLARSALHAQPFSMLLGTELMHVGTRELALRLTIRDELRQQHGFVHGGVISYLADNALTFAGALALGPRVVTMEYKINYLRPAVNGTLIARAELVYAGRGHATCQCNVFVIDGDKEKLVAIAQGTINRVGDGGEGGESAASRETAPN